jgi:hypothetical protein
MTDSRSPAGNVPGEQGNILLYERVRKYSNINVDISKGHRASLKGLPLPN